jgi:hypothetical protein
MTAKVRETIREELKLNQTGNGVVPLPVWFIKSAVAYTAASFAAARSLRRWAMLLKNS